jgi:hypothetical protein
MSQPPKRSGSTVALTDVINEGMASAAPSAAVAPSQPPVRPVVPPRAEPAGGKWAGPVPKAKVVRQQLNVGLPAELDLHRRLGIYKAANGVAVEDVVAQAVHEWLTAHGY